MGFQILRVERLKTMGEVKRSALHTFREIPTENAISDLTESNAIVGPKTADGVYQAVYDRIEQLHKKDKQATRCLEFVVTASPEEFAEDGALSSSSAQHRYFQNSLDWLRKKHGRENVVCAVIHRDEKTPHMAVYIVPVVHREAYIKKQSVNVKGGGRKLIDKPVPAEDHLSAKAYYHCPAALAQLQDDFHAGVSKTFGLDRGVSRVAGREHKKQAQWYAEKQAEHEAALAAIAVKEEDITRNWAKLDQHWGMHQVEVKRLEAEKVRLDVLSVELMTQKADLDVLAATLADGRRRLDLDLVKSAQDEKDLAKRESALTDGEAALKVGLADLQRRSSEINLRGDGQDQREMSLNDRAKAMDELEQERTAKIAAVKDILKRREDAVIVKESALNDRDAVGKRLHAEFVALTQGNTPEQIAGALIVIAATKKKAGIDINHLTNGDCVIILGKTWAIKNNITTAEDMIKSASQEHADYARRVGLPKPKPDGQTQGMKR